MRKQKEKTFSFDLQNMHKKAFQVDRGRRSYLEFSKMAERASERVGSSVRTLETTLPPWLDRLGTLAFSKKLVSRHNEASAFCEFDATAFVLGAVIEGAALSPSIHTRC